eukprot:TRINITY_DN29034_c0_g1_i1.p2 TRINITY_DN29034_c0_g1~~TRINITY_DN29034_c0_g1_i1.p2  ORF type:complete len:367 (-),score=159.30 TRINITY_DN29034_c0_g1_i1:1854-2954(-)
MEEERGGKDSGIVFFRAQRDGSQGKKGEKGEKKVRGKDGFDRKDGAAARGEKIIVRAVTHGGRKRIQRERGDEGEIDGFVMEENEEIRGKRSQKKMKQVDPDEEERPKGGSEGDGEREGGGESEKKKKKKSKRKKKNKKEKEGGDDVKIFFEEYETAEKQANAFSALSVAYPLKDAKDARFPLDPQCITAEIELPKTDAGVGDWLKKHDFHLSSSKGTLSTLLKKRKKGPDGFKRGSPMIVVVSQAAQRACDVIRELRNAIPPRAQKEFPIAKLFAKHMKVEEQVEFLKTKKCVIAVGTPERIRQMCDAGHLSLSTCELLLIDVMPNAKTFNLMTSHDTAHSFFSLFRTHFYERVRDKKTKMAFFA